MPSNPPQSVPSARTLIPLALAVVLTACAGRGDESADQSERLTVPPDLSSERLGEVPALGSRRGDRGQRAEDEAERQRAGRAVAPEPVGMRIRRAGAERWLRIQASEDEAWEHLKDWLDSEGVPLAREEPAKGLIETEWMARPLGPSGGALVPLDGEPSGSPMVDQYLLRVEPDEDASGRTEVFVAHRRLAVLDDDAGWMPQPAERGLEAELLRGFMLYLGGDDEFVARQLAEREERLARLTTDEDERPILVVAESYIATWQRVGLAVDRAAFSVEDRNRARGRFLVRYDPSFEDDDDSPGFFERLAFWREREPELEPGTYAVSLDSHDDGTAVFIRDEDGEPVPDELSARLLTLIRDQLR